MDKIDPVISLEASKVERIYWHTESDILLQIKSERDYAFQKLSTKKDLFNERVILYNNPTKDEERVNLNLCFQFMMMLLAIYYTDEPEVTFSTAEVWNEDVAENFTNLYKHDTRVMKMHIRKYLVQWYKFRYGAVPRVATGYDHVRQCNTFQIIDPRCRWPDPDGSVIENDFRYHGFEMLCDLFSLKADDSYFNIEGISDKPRASDDKNRVADQQHRWINQSQDTSANKKIPVYHHMTSLYDEEARVLRKFMFSTDDAMTRLIRVEEIEPVMPEEIADPNLIEFPIAINARSPEPWDPFGICVPDVIEDKQKHANMYENLMLIKASRMALGADRLYDTTAIKNRAELEKPSLGWRYIGVDTANGSIPLQNLIYEIPQDTMPGEVYNMPAMLKGQAQQDLWMSDLTMGGLAERNVTARESQSAQLNANIRLILHNEINNRWEERFAFLMYRGYMEHFPESGKKTIRINSWLGNQNIILTKKDFVSWLTPDILVLQKSDVDNLNEKNKANYMAIYPLISQDPNIPAISKRYALRKLLKMNWLSRAEIQIQVPPTPEEMDAMQQVELINRNMPVEVHSMDEDHMTYLIVYQKAFNTDAKYVAIEMRKQAYIESGQSAQQRQLAMTSWNWQMANAAGGQLVSNAIAQWNANNPSNAASLQQVRW